MRRVFRIVIGLALVTLGFAVNSSANAAAVRLPQIASGGEEVVVRKFATVPLADDGSPAHLNAMATTGDRLFVVASRDGVVYEITDGEIELFFDVGEALDGRLDTRSLIGGGVRSLAFHPNFASTGVFYTAQEQIRPPIPAEATYLSDTPTSESIGRDSVITEWTLGPDGTVIGPREVVRIGLAGPQAIEQISFNPYATDESEDYGHLYIAHGEGSHLATPIGGQNNDALGKILRLDPQQTEIGPYSIPPANPFVGDVDMLDEVYALGFRNPHNLAFTTSGTLLAVDVGIGNVEEVNVIEPGSDYGWMFREGTFSFVSTEPLDGIEPLIDTEPDPYTYPAAQFIHDPLLPSQGIAGGYAIENGSGLDGWYIYADYGATGDIYLSSIAELESAVTRGAAPNLTQAVTYRATVLLDHDGDPSTTPRPKSSMLDVIDDSQDYDESGLSDIRFGQGPGGELYIMSKRNNTIYLVTNSERPVVAETTGAPPEPALDPEDALRLSAVAQVVSALESFAFENNTYVVSGGGIEGDGKGWFHYASGNYPDSIANVLINGSHMRRFNPPHDPDHTDLSELNPADFMIYRCKDRIGVFAKTIAAESDPDDQEWWDTNDCIRAPIDIHDHRYLSLAQPLTELEDKIRLAEAAEIVDALEAYASANDTYLVEGGGFEGKGRGWFHRETGPYPDSIADVLAGAGYLNIEDPPHDPNHLDLDQHSQSDFMVYACEDRVGVFTKTDTATSDADSQAWWDSRGCVRLPIDTHDHRHLTLSRSLTALDDEERLAASDRIVEALEAYAADHGTFAVVGGGFDGKGRGWFHRKTGPYPDSIANVLAAGGYLPQANLPRDPAHDNIDEHSSADFMVFTCKDRVGVFSKTGGATSDPDVLDWWTRNRCGRSPIDDLDHGHLTLSDRL